MKHFFGKAPRPTALFLFALLAAFGAAQAHPNGTYRVIVRLLPADSLTVEINANAGDVYNAVEGQLTDTVLVPAEAKVYQEKVAYYMFSRLRVTADNQNVLSPQVLLWKKHGKGPADDFTADKAALFDTVHVLTFGGRLPAGARMLRINGQLFPEFGIQTLAEISILWRDTLLDRQWVGLDKTYRFPVSGDSLEASLARTRDPAKTGKASLFLRFITLGFTHILPHGLDHILFVLGLFFFSTRMRPLLMQVTAFTVAHSITLGIALLGIFSLPPQIVEPLIALSIAVVGLENVFFRQVKASRWLIVFAFGLIHGMGFAGVLRNFELPAGGFWPALTGFNIGVEIGQLTVISLAFAATVAFRKKPWYFQRVVAPVSLAISAVGLYWAVQRIWGF